MTAHEITERERRKKRMILTIMPASKTRLKIFWCVSFIRLLVAYRN